MVESLSTMLEALLSIASMAKQNLKLWQASA